MKRHRRYRRMLRHTLLLLVIPLALVGTGYALYSQRVSVNAQTLKPAYSSTHNLLLTYTSQRTNNGGSTQYTLEVTIKNNGLADVRSWQAMFDLPSDHTNRVCDGAVICTLTNSRLAVAGDETTRHISAGQTRTFSLQFTSPQPSYVLQNVSITGQAAPTYETIGGLTVTVTQGTRQGGGGVFYWPFTYRVTNSTGQTVTNWQITMPWDPANGQTVHSMPSTVDYSASATQLIIQSKTPLSNGSSFTFVANLGSGRGQFNNPPTPTVRGIQ